MTDDQELLIETLLIHADRELNRTASVAAPIYQTAMFRSQSAADFSDRAEQPRHPEFYTRFGNPTLAQVERVLAVMEGAEAALVTGSGMAAVTATVLAMVQSGSHVVAQTNHYGGTTVLLRDFLPKFGVEATYVDQRNPAEFEKAMRPNTKLVLVESPSNPLMRLTDLSEVARIARARGALTLADNTFATPLNQRPLEMGIDLVFHSATKYFGGHSDIIAGAVMGSEALIKRVWDAHVLIGAALSPLNAWLLLRGVRTLSVRLQRQSENASALAQFLESHPKVAKVHYPGLQSHPQHALAARQMKGFGGMLSFELKGGFDSVDRFLNALRIATRAPSLGGVETLVVDAAMNFRHYFKPEEAGALGIVPGLMRVSAGLEAASDLVADFDQALGS